ncbi:MAG: DNA alkylation repair protein [Nitrospinae bacterium]|nr:DNA alkylation repair protein [Nitrospinota bacterium]
MEKLTARKASAALKAHASAEKAVLLSGFFKTGKGEYGEGDRFLGVMVPEIRKAARHYHILALDELGKLLASPYNEERLMALIILGARYKKGDGGEKEAIFRLYIKNLSNVNNWNLVDLSAPYISGPHLADGGRELLYKLAHSKNLWERRVAIISTSHFIRNGEFDDTLKITDILINDKHDLIHKACGWMLREVGKRDEAALDRFLKERSKTMPRTMLRYAIERMEEGKRKKYLAR